MKQLIFAALLSTISITGMAEKASVNQTVTDQAPQTAPASSENLSEPKVQANDLINWANRATTAIFGYSYKDYKKTMADNAKYLTPGAWKKYSAHLQSSGNLKTLTEHQLTIIATVPKPSKIVNQGVISGRYSWTVEVPLYTRYETADPKKTITQEENYLITLQIVRMPSDQYPSGVAINSLLQQPMK